MKNVVLTVMCLLFLCSLASAQNSDFRNVRWGMSEEEVIKSEGKEPSEKKENLIIFDGEDVAGIAMNVVYFFEDNKLYLAKYFSSYTDVHKASDNFFELNSVMQNKYGKPKMSIDKPRYVDSLESHLTSMKVTGRGGFSSTWKTKDAVIVLSLRADGSDFFPLNVFYESVKYKYLKDAKDKKDMSKKGTKL